MMRFRFGKNRVLNAFVYYIIFLVCVFFSLNAGSYFSDIGYSFDESYAIATGMILGAICLVYISRNNLLTEKIGLPFYYLWAITITLTIACTTPIVLLLNSFFMNASSESSNILQDSNSIISALVIAPVTEEIIFRGVILKELLKSVNWFWATLLTSILFAVLHANPPQIINAFFWGVFFCYTYVLLKNLYAQIILHFTANLSFAILNDSFAFNSTSSISNMYGDYSLIVVAVGFLVLLYLISKLRKINSTFDLSEFRADQE